MNTSNGKKLASGNILPELLVDLQENGSCTVTYFSNLKFVSPKVSGVLKGWNSVPCFMVMIATDNPLEFAMRMKEVYGVSSYNNYFTEIKSNRTHQEDAKKYEHLITIYIPHHSILIKTSHSQSCDNHFSLRKLVDGIKSPYAVLRSRYALGIDLRCAIRYSIPEDQIDAWRKIRGTATNIMELNEKSYCFTRHLLDLGYKLDIKPYGLKYNSPKHSDHIITVNPYRMSKEFLKKYPNIVNILFPKVDLVVKDIVSLQSYVLKDQIGKILKLDINPDYREFGNSYVKGITKNKFSALLSQTFRHIVRLTNINVQNSLYLYGGGAMVGDTDIAGSFQYFLNSVHNNRAEIGMFGSNGLVYIVELKINNSDLEKINVK